MNLETFERRRLLSLSVVQGYPGYYEVYGDDSPDAIVISVMADSSFTLDGTTYGHASYISVFGNGGDDVISIDIDPAAPVGASINAGSGDDDVTLSGSGAVWGDSGNDSIRISNS